MNIKSLYLKTLRLNNFAIFHHQEISFDPKFNAIIGETGSGKSLILEALEIILGNRVDKKLIRKKAPFASIEAIFSCHDDSINSYLTDLGFPFEDNEIVIKRVIYPSGPTKSYLNFSLCNLTTLGHFTKKYIDFVGQFENQKLLNEKYQLTLLDQYGVNLEQIIHYQKKYNLYSKLKTEIENLQAENEVKNQKIDFLTFKLGEIESLNPSVDEEEDLIDQKKLFQAQQNQKQLCNEILLLISENESCNALSLIKKSLQKATKYSDILETTTIQKLEEINSGLEELSFHFSQILEKITNDINIDLIIERLDKYQRLKNKYGPTTEDMIKNKEKFNQELSLLHDVEFKIHQLIKEKNLIQEQLLKLGDQLHLERQKAAQILEQKLTYHIRILKMDEAQIKIKIEKSKELISKGPSEIQFMAETNLGEGFYKLKDIASGGELSRVLLACRQVLSTKDLISIFLFDEIDTGLGGETALHIGKALAEVACNSQVIAITHLPQIAHFADKLILVSKKTESNNQEKRTISYINEVAGKSKRKVIKSMAPIN